MTYEPSPFEKRAGHWVSYNTAGYIKGRGVHLGGGAGGIFPRRSFSPGKFCVVADPRGGEEVNLATDDLSLLTPNQWDWVCIEAPFTEPQHVRNACKLLKAGGHLIVLGYLPDQLKESLLFKHEAINEDNRLGIYKFTPGAKRGVYHSDSTNDRRRACICRYGALGDQVTMTPLIRALYEDGYDVTINISSHAAMVLENNPYVANTITQERDFVLNPKLGEYWDTWKGHYDRYINLSESVEGSLLKVEGRHDYYLPKAERQTDKNYYEATLEIGGYPNGDPTPELFFTKKEEKKVKELVSRYGGLFGDGPVIAWSVRGSSHHKIYPMMWPVIEKWLANNKRGGFLLLGGTDAERWIGNDPLPDRVVSLINKTSVRESFLITKHADLVIGPETGVMNAASCWDTPKILFLSHSSENALAKHWKNCTALAPEDECHPCFQMHYSLESCPLIELFDDNDNGGLTLPRCTIGIDPNLVLEEIERKV